MYLHNLYIYHMKGKSKFTKFEADAIIALIRKKVVADSAEQKRLRDKIRVLGFYATDFGIGGGYTEHDFLRVVQILNKPPMGIKPKVNDHPIPIPLVRPANTVKKNSFPPISQPDARILILGTMPGDRSLSLNQYYGHGGNQFWKIMFSCFNETFSEDYSRRVDLLLKHKIALWDVLQHCERDGSSDNNIGHEFPNDFTNFFTKHKDITAVLFNGNNAADFYLRYIGYQEGITFEVLPSTSPANTWSTKEAKLQSWGNAISRYLL